MQSSQNQDQGAIYEKESSPEMAETPVVVDKEEE